MKNAKCFDIHDKDVTPEIYTLLFSDAYVELKGNDMWYKISPIDGNWLPCDSKYHNTEKLFKDRVDQGYHNCYHDKNIMKKFCENPCTCAEAVEHFKQWLAHRGVTSEDTLFVKIWW